MSPWHDVPLEAGGGLYNLITEIPKMTKAKMEVATKEASNPIAQDIKKGKLRGDQMRARHIKHPNGKVGVSWGGCDWKNCRIGRGVSTACRKLTSTRRIGWALRRLPRAHFLELRLPAANVGEPQRGAPGARQSWGWGWRRCALLAFCGLARTTRRRVQTCRFTSCPSAQSCSRWYFPQVLKVFGDNDPIDVLEVKPVGFFII